jgi:protein tyrosine phosphatase (PTP) superfamily phosphohydrolase (DUF442 family)
MRSLLLRALLVAAGIGLASGCSHCCRRPQCVGEAGVMVAPPPPPPPAPPGAAPGTPTPFLPQTSQAPPDPLTAQPPPAEQQSGFNPMPPGPDDLSWRPSPGALPRVHLRPPEPALPGKPNERLRLYPPEVEEKVSPTPQKPPEVTDPGPPPALPVGIPEYAVVKDRFITSGRRPMLDGGLDWLQENGYRTVLNVRRPDEDDATDRKEVEKRGLKYVSLVVSPETLTKKVVEEFGRIVGDAKGYPLFVYDRDGSLRGGLWYLHFRTAEGLNDEAAGLRARALGLRETHREMWSAIRKLLGAAS